MRISARVVCSTQHNHQAAGDGAEHRQADAKLDARQPAAAHHPAVKRARQHVSAPRVRQPRHARQPLGLERANLVGVAQGQADVVEAAE